MNYSSYLNPSAIIAQCGSAITQLQEDNWSLDPTEGKIEIFIEDQTIISKSFHSRKQLMEDFRLLVETMRQINEADIVDFDELKNAVGTEVLEGEKILTGKQKEKDNQIYHNNQMARYVVKARMSYIMNNLFSAYYLNMARYHKQLADWSEESYKIWLNKEEKYDQIECITSGLFSTSESLRTTIQQGINAISASILDGVYQPDMSAVWRKNLQNETDKFNEAFRKKAEEMAEKVSVYNDDGNLIDYNWKLLSGYSYDTIMLILWETEGTGLPQMGVMGAYGDKEVLLERLKDYRMKEAIRTVGQQERFSFDIWENADLDERKEILQDYKDAIAGIYGISTKDEINFYTKEPNEGFTNQGSYSHGSKQVNINEWVIENWDAKDSYKQFNIVRHELRHGYQHSAVDKPEDFIVSDKTIKSWSENIKDKKTIENDGWEAYRGQPIEVDARDFEGLYYYGYVDY